MKVLIAIVVILAVLTYAIMFGGAHFVMNGKRPTSTAKSFRLSSNGQEELS